MLLLILFFSLLFRLINLNQSLWLDEAINVLAARDYKFWDLMTKYPLADFHPPGYFAILWVWVRVFGTSETAVRIPSVIVAVLTVYLTYLIGKELFSKKTGFLSAIFSSFAPLHLYYSQEARMYAFAAFAVTLSIFFMVKIIKDQKYAFWGYAASVFLILYSDYLAYFILPAQLAYMVFYQKKKMKTFLLSLGLGIATILPWLLVVFPEQLKIGQNTASSVIGWKNIVGGTSIKEMLLLPTKILIGRISVENKYLYTALLLLIAVPYTIALEKATKKKELSTKLIAFWLVLPPILGFLLSFLIPVFAYFRFIFILPAFYILVALGVERFAGKKASFLIVLIVISELVTSFTYILNPQFHREDWRDAANFISKNYNDKTAVIFENNEVPAPFKYYFNYKSSNLMPGLKKVPAYDRGDVWDLDKLLEGKENIYFFEYLVDITDPGRILEERIKRAGFKEARVYDFRGVGFVRLFLRDQKGLKISSG